MTLLPAAGLRCREVCHNYSAMLQRTVDNLEPKQERAILALLNEGNVAKAAQAAEVSERTLYRWLGEAPFSSAYRKARREAFGQAIALTQRYAPLAVNTLAKVMADVAMPASARVSAAAVLMKFGREGIELDDLAARVEALEQTAKPPSNRRPWFPETA